MNDSDLERRGQSLSQGPPTDEWFQRLRELYRRCSDRQKGILRERLAYGEPWRGPSENDWFAANWTERRPWLANPDAVRRAIIETACKAFEAGGDWRDSLVALCPLYHVAILLGLDPDAVFDDAATQLSGSASELLRSFVARQPSNKALRLFGWEAVRRDNGQVVIRSSG